MINATTPAIPLVNKAPLVMMDALYDLFSGRGQGGGVDRKMLPEPLQSAGAGTVVLGAVVVAVWLVVSFLQVRERPPARSRTGRVFRFRRKEKERGGWWSGEHASTGERQPKLRGGRASPCYFPLISDPTRFAAAGPPHGFLP